MREIPQNRPRKYNMWCAQLCGKDRWHMVKKYIRFYNRRIYAIYYRKSSTMYYNLNFSGRAKLIIFK